MSKVLDSEQLEKELAGLKNWKVEDDKLTRDFSFADFREAMSFMVRIAFEAEDLGHHPELFNVYKNVRIQLATHDAGGKITSKDIDLAKRIEAL